MSEPRKSEQPRANDQPTPNPTATAQRPKRDEETGNNRPRIYRFPDDAPRQPKTMDAWKRLAYELAFALKGLDEDEWLVLSLKKRNRFVQFMNQGGAGFRVETVSDYFLNDDDRLTEADRALLLEMGWSPPTNLPDQIEHKAEGSANYYLDLANPVPLVDVASLAVNTLINVHRATHPNSLEYTTGGSANTSIRFPNLRIRRAADA